MLTINLPSIYFDPDKKITHIRSNPNYQTLSLAKHYFLSFVLSKKKKAPHCTTDHTTFL